jgi:hypothetical protein
MTNNFEVHKMPDSFEEFKAAVEREYDVDATAEPLHLLKGLHVVLVNLSHTLEQLGQELPGRHAYPELKLVEPVDGVKELEK